MNEHVTIVTPFRDSQQRVTPYWNRVTGLDYPSGLLRFVFVEGDSVDETLQALQALRDADRRVRIVEKSTGAPRFGSVIDPVRFQTLAAVFNAGLDAVDYQWTDYVLMLPCDIDFHPDLLRRLLMWSEDIVAPFVWQNNRFYDTWGFSQNDIFWTDFIFGTGPAHDTDLLLMTTVGCVKLIDADVLRAGARYTPEEVDRGLCKSAREKGYLVFADPTTNVFHQPT